MGHDAAGAPLAFPGEVDGVYAKITKRIVPFLALLGLMAWLDRYNLGFAKLRMVKDLGFSEAVYGFGAGILYLGYLLFEVPSNLLLERIGARKTFARITILWGITSITMMFVKTATWFYILRFLLGSFEAGLYPGAILYLTYWFPARRRAHVVALFFLAAPLSIIVGSPVSGWIIHSMEGQAGLANWQWLFFLEGIPSVLIGLLALVILVDKPQGARWLTEREKQLVLADLAADNRQAGPREHEFGRALRVPRVWLLGAMYFCLISANQTIPFWLPSIIQGLGVKNALTIGMLLSVPYIAAMIGMVLVGRHSDRTLERRYHAALPCLSCALGLIGIGIFAKSPVLAFIAIIVTVAGTLTASVVFWQVPPMLLASTAAAGGIALTNSLGSFSGWIGPTVVGWLADVTGKTTTGLYVVGGLEILGTILILRFVPRRSIARSAASG
jgi:D-galactonate transporter